MMKLLKLEGDPRIYSPIILRREMFLEEFTTCNSSKCIDKILSAYGEASKEREIMLIEGTSTLSSGTFISCSVPHLASKLNAQILLISRFKNDHIIDEIFQARDYALRWNTPISGVIINRVPEGRIERAERIIKPFLEKNGIKVLGIVPEDVILGAITVREIHEAVGGNVLAGEEGMDKLVETVLVGAMTPESAMRYFQKAKNELVITGGDRTDIVFAALEAGARAVILTGNLYPSVKIFPRADDLAVPLILVPYDTYTTLRMVQGIVGKIRPDDQRRIDRVKRLITENTEWKQILLDNES
ncbi:TPA: phosphotransacetylase family protein, partial [Candidatus Bathyarchaeota archaeon]|nr:phosphotransacetylase family protein [Candidatus Bathyarchaeota archaeon]